MCKKKQRIKSKDDVIKTFSESAWKKMVFIVVCFFFSLTSNAQCAMCRAALGGDANTKQAEAVNDGIVYLMVIPYLLIGLLGYFIYRMYWSKKK